MFRRAYHSAGRLSPVVAGYSFAQVDEAGLHLLDVAAVDPPALTSFQTQERIEEIGSSMYEEAASAQI